MNSYITTLIFNGCTWKIWSVAGKIKSLFPKLFWFRTQLCMISYSCIKYLFLLNNNIRIVKKKKKWSASLFTAFFLTSMIKHVLKTNKNCIKLLFSPHSPDGPDWCGRSDCLASWIHSYTPHTGRWAHPHRPYPGCALAVNQSQIQI